MNYIEAHQIVQEYVDIFASGRNGKLEGVYLGDLSFASVNWKEKLMHAFQLFFAHGMLWGHLQSFDDYYIFMYDPGIVEDKALFLRRKELAQIVSRENTFWGKRNKKKINEAYTELFKDEVGQIYGYDEIVRAYNEMVKYMRDIFSPAYKQGKDTGWADIPFAEMVYRYSVQAYNSAHIEYQQGYDVYFYSFDQMRKWLSENSMKRFFKGYEAYLHKWKN